MACSHSGGMGYMKSSSPRSQHSFHFATASVSTPGAKPRSASSSSSVSRRLSTSASMASCTLPRACFEGMKGDFLELMRLVVAAVETDIPEGTKWSYAFCLCDCLGAAVPVGTGFGFEKKTS